MDREQGRELIELKNQIERQFTKSDWIEIGFALGVSDIINGHDRLLRSLSFGDDDYEGNILDVLNQIVEKDPTNFEELKSFISHKYSAPVVSDFVSTAHKEVPKRMVTFAPQVFSIPAKEQNKQLVAVMLPFKYAATFAAVKAACDSLSLTCLKADDIWENSTFIQDVFDLIFTSQVVVADFTGKNPNVFYEVGIAHTLGKTVIPITQNIEDVPSDLGHHRALKYLPNQEGYQDMTKELIKRLHTLTKTEAEY